MRLVSFATVLIGLAGLGFAAHAEEDIHWFGYADKYGAALIYGLPETSFAPIAFYCDAESGELTVSFEFEPIDATDGVEVTVLLRAADIEVPIQTTGQRLDMDDLFILEGRTVLDDRLIGLINSQGTLQMTIEDGAEEYPLDGAREAASGLIETCRLL